MFDTMQTAKRIKEMRMKNNMTQMGLADALGVSYQAVSNWERGNSMPDISKLGELSGLLGCSIDELLGSSKETETVKKILKPWPDPKETAEGEEETTEDVPEKQNLEEILEEITPVISIIPPNQTKSILEEAVLGEDNIHLKDVIGVAPFLDEEILDQILEKVNAVDEMNDLVQIAPFLSEETLDRVADKICAELSIRDLVPLAPFLSDETLDKLADQINIVENIQQIVPLAPFLSDETLDKLVEKTDVEAGIEHIAALAPFLSDETLHKVAQKLIEKGGISALKHIAPFL